MRVASDLRHGIDRALSRAILVVFSALSIAAVVSVVPARAASGDPDATWGTDGSVTFPSSGWESLQGRIGLGSAGNVVLAFSTEGPECAVRSFLSDGTPDPDFGTGGLAIVPLGGNFDDCDAVVVQPDGRILVAGLTSYTGFSAVTVARLESDGTLDPTWAGTGVVEAVIGAGTPTGSPPLTRDNDLLIDPFGRVVVAAAMNGGVGLARFDSSGAPDPTFGVGGEWVVDAWPGENEAVQELAVRPSGKLVVGVSREPFDDGNGSVLQLNLNGTRDASFGNLGTVDLPMGMLGGIALEPDGDLLVVGTADGTTSGITILRLLPTGVLDPSFGSGGIITASLQAAFGDVAVQADGKFVIAGSLYTAPAADIDFFARRHLPNGSVDPTWTGDGVIDVRSSDFGFTLALQADGAALVAGVGLAPGSVGAIVRFQGDVGPVPLCGNGELDPGEDCDDDSPCCGPACTYESAGFACGAASGCSGLFCDGAGACASGPRPAGTACGSVSACSAFVCDGAGACANAPRPDGTPCSDGLPCTADACASGSCVSVAAPSTGCRQQLAPRGQLLLSDPNGERGDKLIWSWQRGEATTEEEFAQQDYDVCIYDFESGGPTLVTHLATAGDTCVFDCWKLKGQNKIYVDVFGTHDGLRQIYPKAGGDGAAGVKLQARGENLPPFTLPLVPPVTIQLVSEAGDCWAATYSAPRKNDEKSFKAKPDP
jgi:uncharacterized delta-60 repeat protein